MKAQFVDWGLMDYKQAWDKQQEIFDACVEYKKDKTGEIPYKIILCEHPHVYTLGKHGNSNNLLIQDEFMNKINATYYHIDRGGDITYHGPGQIVGYPIIDLEEAKLSLKEYIFQMEEAIIQTLDYFGIQSSRLQSATGVWLDVGKPTARKICAIGVKASRFVTMHGFAFNINTDLNYFSYINPCGFVDKGVTSLASELKTEQDMEKVKEILKEKLFQNFKIEAI